MQGTFKRENPYNKRLELSKRLKEQYKNRVPIIVEIGSNSNLKLDKNRYISPKDISLGAFLNEVRKKSSIKPEEAIFMFCDDNVLVPTNHLISQVYERYADDDGFLYLTVTLENTFGDPIAIICDLFNHVLQASADLSKSFVPEL